MPATLKLKLRGDAKQKHGFEIGSLLQGVMMGAIDGEYADQLHESNLHSYSQLELSGQLVCLTRRRKKRFYSHCLN